MLFQELEDRKLVALDMLGFWVARNGKQKQANQCRAGKVGEVLTVYEIIVKDVRTRASFIGTFQWPSLENSWVIGRLVLWNWFWVSFNSFSCRAVAFKLWLTVRSPFLDYDPVHTITYVYFIYLYVKWKQIFHKTIFTFTMCNAVWYFLFHLYLKKKPNYWRQPIKLTLQFSDGLWSIFP